MRRNRFSGRRCFASYLATRIKVELASENSLTNIVSEQFDAGVRLDDLVDKDMIAVPISPDQRMLVVGSPAYFNTHGRPAVPQDLVEQRCVNLRLPTQGGLYAWEFEKAGRALTVRVDGQLVLNSQGLMLEAAREGFGLAYLPADVVRPDCEEGVLIAVLDDWSPSYPGYRLYFPSRRQQTPAFALLVEALRYSPASG